MNCRQQIQKSKTPYEQEQLTKRYQNLSGGVAIVHVGGVLKLK